jgi:YggT family protein
MEDFLRILMQALVTAAWVMVLGRVLLSWIDPGFERPLGQFVFSLTEPFLAPIRKVLPQSGSLDWSPLVLLLLLGLLMRMTWML